MLNINIMEETIFLFYKHFNTFKGHKRSIFFPSIRYENYFVPIDENTLELLVEKIEHVYQYGDSCNQKTVQLFDKIVNALYHVNLHEFE